MFKSKGTAFLFDALLESANKRAAEASPMGSILADAMHAASTEIDRLNNELESTTRHMEMAEAAWLRETAGNIPKMHTTPVECSVPRECTSLERPLGDPEIALEMLKLRVAELEQAIRRLAEQDATLSVCDGNVTVTMDATLTDAERDDLQVWLAECLRQGSTATEGGNEELAERWRGRAQRAAALLERTK